MFYVLLTFIFLLLMVCIYVYVSNLKLKKKAISRLKNLVRLCLVKRKELLHINQKSLIMNQLNELLTINAFSICKQMIYLQNLIFEKQKPPK